MDKDITAAIKPMEKSTLRKDKCPKNICGKGLEDHGSSAASFTSGTIVPVCT